MPPSISIIVPSFNQSKKLERCLFSVLSQDFSELEVILVDDGSTDGSFELATEIASKDSRLTIRQQTNKGAGAARNSGLSVATGEFIHFMDSDDWVEPGIYTWLFKLIKRHPELDLIVFQYTEVDFISKEPNRIDLFGLGEEESKLSSFADSEHLLLRTSVVPWNKLIRRSYLQAISARFDEVRFANDRSFHFQTVIQTNNILLCGALGVNHEVGRLTSLSSSHGLARISSTLKAFEATSKIVGNLTPAAQKIAFDVNMINLMWEYQRARQDQKVEIACEIFAWFESGKSPFEPSDFREASWQPCFTVLKSIALSKSVGEEVIPIVMAANELYMPFLLVTLHSISCHLSEGSKCIVYVMHTGLPTEAINLLEQELGYTNVTIFCLSFAHETSLNSFFSRGHYSAEMYLRLWIPELLDVYPKVLYLDCDLLVQTDLSKLFETDISNFDIAGVRDFNNANHFRYVERDLGLKADFYVNSGVLLLNTKRLKASNFRMRCLEVLDRYPILNCPDQDMINVVCSGNIFLLDSGWNYLWNYGFSKYRLPPDGEAWFKQDFEESRKKRFIIHYSSAIKPWNFPHLEDADLFWSCARETRAYSKILKGAASFKVSESQKRLSEMRRQACPDSQPSRCKTD